MLRSHSSGTAPFGGSGRIHSTGPKLMTHSSSGPLVSTPVSDDYSELLISKLIAIKVGAAYLKHTICQSARLSYTDRLTMLYGLVIVGGR